jgi:hypothetical protein
MLLTLKVKKPLEEYAGIPLGGNIVSIPTKARSGITNALLTFLNSLNSSI